MKKSGSSRQIQITAILISFICAACSATGGRNTPALSFSTEGVNPSTPSFSTDVVKPSTPTTLAQTETPVLSTTITPTLTYDEAVHLFDYDPSLPFEIKDISTKNDKDVTVRSITYAAHNATYGIKGRTLAYLVTPAGKGPFAGAVFMHWLGQTNGNRDEFLEEAIMLAQKGMVSLLVQGTFPWSQAPSNDQADRKQVIDQVIELRRALDLLLSLPEVDPQRIGYVGHDYGALYGGILAGLEKRVKTYVLIAGMGNFSDWSLKYWPVTGANGAETYRQSMRIVDPINYVGHAAPETLFFQFARNDQFIPEEVAMQFYDAASEPKQIRWYDTSHSMKTDEVRGERDEWLAKQLLLQP